RFPSGLVGHRGLNANCSGTWHKEPLADNSGPNRGNAQRVGVTGGWCTVSDLNCRGKKSGPVVQMHFEARRGANTGALVFSDQQGALVTGDEEVLQVNNPAWQPDHIVPVEIEYLTGNGATYGGSGYLNTNGRLIITAGAPGTNIARKASGWSIRASVTWIEEV